MGRRIALAVVLVAAALAAWWLLRRKPPAPSVRADAARAAAAAETPSGTRPADGAPVETVRRKRADLAEARHKADALRAAIAAAAARRPAPPAPAPAAAAAPAEPPPEGLKNRLGGRDELVKRLNSAFMPLARECIEQAVLASPQLGGMLAIDIETVADEELGGVIDVAELAANNEVTLPSLVECIRESALSVTFPAPLVNGREKFMLTLPIGD